VTARALEGVRVLDFTQMMMGPWATQFLGDLGADVLKVERPGVGEWERGLRAMGDLLDGQSPFFLAMNRNKRSVAIDLKHPRAREVVLRLAEHAALVVENFRPGVMDRLGFGHEQVKRIRPDIVYASATGFGASGPMVDRPGQDLLIQAYSGLVAATGHLHERPTPIGFAAADQHGAALLAMGILGAYVRKLQTGQGTRVEANLLNAGLDLQTEPLTLYFTKRAGREAFRRDRNLATWFHEAPYGVYRIKDGFLALSLNDPGRLAAALGSERLKELIDVDRYRQRDRYAAAVAGELATRSYQDLVPGLDEQKIWYQRVHEYDDLQGDPQIRHNQVFREVEVRGGRATLVNHPNRYDGEVPPLRRLAIELGEHTREVLDELGYPAAEIDRLIEDNAVVAPARAREEASA
jgi:crotonobetainyl-CoA:carnitine CoA-transferase CaiB-like acyl-CoA transferase